MLTIVDERIEAYARAHTTPVPELFERLREVTLADTELPQMQVGPLEGTFLKLMVQLTGARRVLEIGMFTGYSGLMMASGLPEDGTLVTCDVDPHAESIARRFFDESPWGDRITIRMGPALETIATLEGPFDLVFVDADKGGSIDYFEAVLPKLRTGGVILADNVLWSGRAALDPSDEDSQSTLAIRAFNDHVAADPRVDQVMLTLRDGVTMIRKR